MRYVEARTDGAVRSHHLVALDEDDALAGTLRRAATGATLDRLAGSRSSVLRPLAERLRALPAVVDDWAASVAHMHANRLLRSAARGQELVVHDCLACRYRSCLARPGGAEVFRAR
jgi:hypothetical protein